MIRDGQHPLEMKRLSLIGGDHDGSHYEAFVQQLAFDHPTCLPIAETDEAYEQLVSICRYGFMILPQRLIS